MADGIFIDIFGRLNLASFTKVYEEAVRGARTAGDEAGRGFSTGITTGLDVAKAEFAELSQAANSAYREMEISFRNLAAREAEINNLRAQNFNTTSQRMIAAQKAVDEAIANSTRLSEAAAGRQAELAGAAAARSGDAALAGGAVAGRGMGRDSSGLGRTANVVGGASALAGAGIVYEGVKTDSALQRTMQTLQNTHQDALHTAGYIQNQTQAIYKISSETGFTVNDLAKAYSSVEAEGYRGQQAISVLDTTAKLAVASHTELSSATEGLTTSLRDLGNVMGQINSPNMDVSKGGLGQMTQMAGQFLQAIGQLKGGDPNQLFGALGNIEPSAVTALAGLSGSQASGQILSAMTLLDKAGIHPDQASHNISRIVTNLASIPPGSKMEQMLAQILPDHQPEDIANIMHNQGIPAVFQMLSGAMKPDKDGKINIGFHRNDQTIRDVIQQDLDQLPPEAKAFLDAHPEIMAGNARNASLKKSLGNAPWGQDVLALGSWEASLHGPNRFTKQGSPENLYPAQVANLLFGSGDIARTGQYLLEHADEFAGGANQIAKGGQGALDKGFNNALQLPDVEFKKLTTNVQNLSAELAEHLLPTLVTMTGGINSFVTKFPVVASALVDAVVGAGSAFVIFKGGEAIFKLGKGMADLGGKVGELADINWGAIRTGATGLADAEAVSATNIKAGGTALEGELAGAGAGAASTIGGSVATAGAEIEAGASKFSAAISGAVAGLPALIAGWLSKEDLDKALGDARSRNTPQQNQDLDAINSGKNPAPGWGSRAWPGRASGGIAGHFGGGGQYGSGVLDGWSPGTDNMLAATSDGNFVALSGGEGILTPQATARLGGKRGIDALNKNEAGLNDYSLGRSAFRQPRNQGNPWEDPAGVGAEFFTSFAHGVAKTSPWGKFLEGPAQSIDSLVKQSREALADNDEGGSRMSRTELEKEMLRNMTPEQLAAAGIHRGKRGGWLAADGSALPNPYAPTKGGGQAWLQKRLEQQGLSPSEARGILAMNQVEGGASNPMSLLGFTEGQAQGPEGHLQAFMGQWNDSSRRGQGGSIPGVDGRGNVQNWDQYMTWIRTSIVGQNGSPSDWQGNAQPSASDYQNRLMGALANTPQHVPWHFYGGGVVGHFGGGGVFGIMGNGGAPESPASQGPNPSAPKPAPPSPQVDPTLGGMIKQDYGGDAPHGGSSSNKAWKPPQGMAPPPPPAKQDQSTAPRPVKVPVPVQPTPEQGESPTKRTDAMQNPSRPMGIDNTSQGFRIGGGVVGAAESAASSMGGPMGAAAQPAFELANRAIGYAGQLVGIGISGLMETFLPNNSPLADPSHNLFGKMAMGIAGMHPSGPNTASQSQSAQALQPKQDLQQGESVAKMLPQVHMPNATIHNYNGDHEGQADAWTKALNRVNGGTPGFGGN